MAWVVPEQPASSEGSQGGLSLTREPLTEGLLQPTQALAVEDVYLSTTVVPPTVDLVEAV
jgi:hypothetical protein